MNLPKSSSKPPPKSIRAALVLSVSFIAVLFAKIVVGDFPGGAVVKNPPANAGDTGSSPGPGRSHMPRNN